MESAFELEITEPSAEREKEIMFPVVMGRYGLGWGVELRIGNYYKSFGDHLIAVDGFSDVELGAEIQLFKGTNKRTEIALMSHLFLPTGSDGISNERVGNESLLLVWHEFTEIIGIEYNIGYSNFEMDSDKGDFVYSFVVDYEISEESGIFFETYGELIEFKEFEANLDLGFAYQFTEKLELELAAGTGINHEMVFALIGLSWRIGEQEW